MKTKLEAFLLAAMVAAVVAGSSSPVSAQTTNAPNAAASWAGTWEGKLDGVPSVILKITQNNTALQGQADFYILRRADAGAPVVLGKMSSVMMINMHLQGNTLDFQVVREDRGVTPANKTVLSFTMEPTGNGTAKLKREGGEPIEVAMSKVQ